MKIQCDICKRQFLYPFDQNTHRHTNVELDGVPVNFWSQVENMENFHYTKHPEEKGIFKYKDLFQTPLVKNISLNEGNTPLVLYSKNIYLKDESKNPTGSFKDRGMPLLMNEVLYHHKNKLAIVSTGNAAISMCRYAKKYGLKSVVFVPESLSSTKVSRLNADEIYLSKDIIDSFEDFFKYCRTNNSVFNGFLSSNVSYLLGLETLTYEIYDKLDDVDIIILPCASGGNAVAQINAYNRLYNARLIKKIPHFIIVQIKGGDPIAEGIKKHCSEWLYIINTPTTSKTLLSEDTCFNYLKLFNFAKTGYLSTISICDDDINQFILENGNMGYDYTSLSVFAAWKKLDLHNKKVVLIITAKGDDIT